MSGAYRQSIQHSCQRCNREARYQVFNARNAPMGYFCRMCSANVIYELNRPDTAATPLSSEDKT